MLLHLGFLKVLYLEQLIRGFIRGCPLIAVPLLILHWLRNRSLINLAKTGPREGKVRVFGSVVYFHCAVEEGVFDFLMIYVHLQCFF